MEGSNVSGSALPQRVLYLNIPDAKEPVSSAGEPVASAEFGSTGRMQSSCWKGSAMRVPCSHGIDWEALALLT